MKMQEEALQRQLEKTSKDIFDETKKGFLVGTICGIEAYVICDDKEVRIKGLSVEEAFKLYDDIKDGRAIVETDRKD